MSNDAYLRTEWKGTAEMVRRNLESGANFSNETRRLVNEANARAEAAQAQVVALRTEVEHLRTMVVGALSNGNFS